MMPDSNLPRWGRNTLRGIATIMYALTAVLGLIGTLWPPRIEGELNIIMLIGSGMTLTLTGIICAVATIAHRWRTEFMAVWWVGAALIAYVAIAWSQKPVTPLTALFMASTLALSLALMHRGISLTIFAQRTRTERVRRFRKA